MKLPRNARDLKDVRSKLRQDMPAPELVLWQKLRGRQLGVKFRRQYAAGNYILDFYAPEIQLAIEIDGESHFEDVRAQERDRFRDQVLTEHGIRVLRFINPDVMQNPEGVVERILEAIRTTPS